MGAGRPVESDTRFEVLEGETDLAFEGILPQYGAAAINPTKTVPAGSVRVGAYLVANALSVMWLDWPISTR